MPMSKKRDMLSMNTKTMARTQYESPNDYIQYLVRNRKPYRMVFSHSELQNHKLNFQSNSDLSAQKKYSCIESLRVALTNNNLEWVQEFGSKGLKQVLSLLNDCFRQK